MITCFVLGNQWPGDNRHVHTQTQSKHSNPAAHTLREYEVLLALDLSDLLYYYFTQDMDMVSSDTPERQVLDIKVRWQTYVI